ncbi:hypothetical protein TNCV_5107671 [Trichonephila clavipes]|nr:hypothetical protein TNCV_5107671 [Trichonephila clavipes]
MQDPIQAPLGDKAGEIIHQLIEQPGHAGKAAPGSCTIWRPETQNSAFLRYPLHVRFLHRNTRTCSSGVKENIKATPAESGAADSDKEMDGSTSVNRAANLLAVVRTGGTSVENDEAEVFRLLLGEVVVGMGIGNKVSLCIVGNITDVEGMVVEGASLDIGILGVGGWDSDIVAVEVGKSDESFFIVILLTWVTPWSESPSKISVSEEHKRSGSEMTPRQEFKDLLGKTRPLPGHSSIGSLRTRIQLHSSMSPPTTESNKGGSVLVIWQNPEWHLPEIHPEYSDTRGNTSRLTRVGSLLPPVYSEAWVKGIPRTPFSSLRDAAYRKHAGRKTNVVSQKQINILPSTERKKFSKRVNFKLLLGWQDGEGENSGGGSSQLLAFNSVENNVEAFPYKILNDEKKSDFHSDEILGI